MSIFTIALLAFIVFALSFALGEWLADGGSLRSRDSREQDTGDPAREDR